MVESSRRNQATDRAHRIGQKRTIYSVKLITKGTIEEGISAAESKRSIMDATLMTDEQVMQKLMGRCTGVTRPIKLAQHRSRLLFPQAAISDKGTRTIRKRLLGLRCVSIKSPSTPTTVAALARKGQIIHRHPMNRRPPGD